MNLAMVQKYVCLLPPFHVSSGATRHRADVHLGHPLDITWDFSKTDSLWSVASLELPVFPQTGHCLAQNLTGGTPPLQKPVFHLVEHVSADGKIRMPEPPFVLAARDGNGLLTDVIFDLEDSRWTLSVIVLLVQVIVIVHSFELDVLNCIDFHFEVFAC